jgi:hypothetical protein
LRGAVLGAVDLLRDPSKVDVVVNFLFPLDFGWDDVVPFPVLFKLDFGRDELARFLVLFNLDFGRDNLVRFLVVAFVVGIDEHAFKMPAQIVHIGRSQQAAVLLLFRFACGCQDWRVDEGGHELLLPTRRRAHFRLFSTLEDVLVGQQDGFCWRALDGSAFLGVDLHVEKQRVGGCEGYRLDGNAERCVRITDGVI